eukprot:265958_1
MYTTFVAALITIYLINGCKSYTHPQYGFSHRVNDPDQIDSVLKHGGNAIEIDICYGRNTDQIEDWYVSHSDLNYCNNVAAVSLTAWLTHLKCLLYNNPSYINQFAMLWLDIKDPAEFKLNQVPKIVQSMGFPPNMKILYDLTGFNSNGKIGFDQLAARLHRNEGITFCAGKSCKGDKNTVRDIYEYYKSKRFWRGTFNTGDSVNIDENFLIYANSKNFNEPADPFRFKLVFSWTHNKQDEILAQINPSNKYHTDGQIYGDWTSEWNDDERYIKMFSDSINRYDTVERFATSNDNPFFNYNRHDYNKYGDLGFLVDRNGDTMDITDSKYIALKSNAHDKYVTIYSDGSMDATATDVTLYEKFILYEVRTVNYILHVSNYYVSALNSNDNYGVKVSAEWPYTTERWRIVNVDNGTVALQSISYNRYLTARANGQLDAGADTVGKEQKFVLVPWLSWLDQGEVNFTTTEDMTTVYPTLLPTTCPTQWPVEGLTKEEKSWFLAGIIFIILSIVSVMILCYLGCSVYRKAKEKAKGNKLGTYARTHSDEVEAGVIKT